MRKLKIILPAMVISLSVFAGCSLFSDSSLDNFEMQATIALDSWTGTAYWHTTPDGIVIYGRKNIGNCDTETLDMRLDDFDGKGTYPVYQTYFNKSVGCNGIFTIGSAEESNGNVTITSYDETESVIKGEFRFEVTADYDYDHIKQGESFMIVGRFRAKPVVSVGN